MADLSFDRLQEFPERDKISLTTGHPHTQARKQHFVCEICKKQFSSRGSLKRHSMNHQEGKPHVCRQCGKSFKRKDNLAYHLQTHSGTTNFKCEICKKRCRSKKGLERHRLVHSVENPHVCQHCGRRFIRKEILTRHLVLLHTNGKQPTCGTDSEQFQSGTHPTDHSLDHSTEKVPVCDCGQCGKTLETSWSSFYPQDARDKENRTMEFPENMLLPPSMNRSDAYERNTSFNLTFGDAYTFQTQPPTYFEHGGFTYFEGGSPNHVVPSLQMCPAIDSRWWESDSPPVASESLHASFPVQWGASNCITGESAFLCSMPNVYPNYVLSTLQ